MTKLVSLKRTAADKKAEREKYDTPCPSGGDDYDYSTRMSLNGDVLKKLGLDLSKLDVEQKVTISAKAYVKAVRTAKGETYDRDSLELQMTDIAIDTEDGDGAVGALSKGISEAENDDE